MYVLYRQITKLRFFARESANYPLVHNLGLIGNWNVGVIHELTKIVNTIRYI